MFALEANHEAIPSRSSCKVLLFAQEILGPFILFSNWTDMNSDLLRQLAVGNFLHGMGTEREGECVCV